MKFEFFPQNMCCSLQTMPQNPQKWSFLDWKLLKNGILGQKLFVFVCQHVSPCFSYLQCTYSVTLIKYKLIYWLFILKMVIFSPKMAKRWHFWEMNIFILLVGICTQASLGITGTTVFTFSKKIHSLNPLNIVEHISGHCCTSPWLMEPSRTFMDPQIDPKIDPARLIFGDLLYFS